MIKELHSTDDHVVLYLLRRFLVEPLQQVMLLHDGDWQPEAKQEASALQTLCRPAYHQSTTRGVRQGEEILTGRREGGDVHKFCDTVYLYLDISLDVKTECHV